MPKKRKQYPAEYRRQIVELVRSGQSPESLAREFEPTAPTIRTWVKMADLADGHGDGTVARLRDELRRTKRELNSIPRRDSSSQGRIGPCTPSAPCAASSVSPRAATTPG